jgi:hypothetical protein
MEGILWVDGLDKFDVDVPGWQTRQVEILPSSLSCIEFIGVQWAKEKPAAGAAAGGAAANANSASAPAQRVLFAIVPSDAQAAWKPDRWFLLEHPQIVLGCALIEELKNKPLRLMIANEGALQAKIRIVVARQVQSDCCCPVPGPKNVAPLNASPCPPAKDDCPPANTGNGNPCPPPATNDCQPTQQQPSDCAPEKQPDDDCGAQDQKNPSAGETGSAN